MKKQFLALAVLSIVVITGCKKNTEQLVTTDALSVTPAVATTITGQVVPNELLVKFKTGTSEKSRTQTLSFINGKVSEHILTKAMEFSGDNDGIYLVNTNTDVFAAIARMKGESNIEYAEPNWIYTHATAFTSNDFYYTNGSLWGMYSDDNPNAGPTGTTNPYGSQAEKAWANGNTGSPTVYVGVIDEGAMWSHEDLTGNFGIPIEINGITGTDDDHNGYVDDKYGWDFVNNDNTTFDGTGDDHGTHVSGTIGAKGGNRIGVAGINWNVKIISAKFLGTNGGTTANAILAVDYITDLKRIDELNIVATNNSWGGGGYSQGLYDAIERANTAGILFIAAAGNSGVNIDTSPSYPASYTNANIIAVAAIDQNGAIASWSNYSATSVDLGAPGVGIISTVPVKSRGKIVSSYASYSGTSMATPHVTGAAALYASTNNLTPANAADAAFIKAAILGSGTTTASLSGKCATGKRLNVSGF